MHIPGKKQHPRYLYIFIVEVQNKNTVKMKTTKNKTLNKTTVISFYNEFKNKLSKKQYINLHCKFV